MPRARLGDATPGRPHAGRSRPVASKPSPVRYAADLWPAAVIALAGLVTYGNSLSGPFILDDINSIVYNTQIHEWWRLGSVLFPEGRSSVDGRPLVNFSLAINYALGGLDVRGYHAWNIVVHILCALLVFGVVRRTLELPGLQASFGSRTIKLAFWTALIWVVHPLNSEVVDYLIQRTESMMALFLLLTLYASIRALHSRLGMWWRAAAVVSCTLGMACKESMVLAPLLVMAYDSTYVFGSVKRALASRWRLYASLATTWLLLAALVWPGPRSNTAGFANDDGVGPWSYLLNQTIMVTQYLRLTVWPRLLVVHYGFPRVLTLDEVTPYALFVGFLLTVTIVGVIVKPKLGFLGAWFFITLAPASSVLPIATEVGAERRMYLPLVSLVLLAVVGGFLLWQLVERHWSQHPIMNTRAARHGGTAVLALVAIMFSTRTIARNREYASTLLLARTAVAGWPNGETHDLLGKILLISGSHEEGLAQLRAAIPFAPRVHYNLGIELLNDGKLDEGLAHLQEAVVIGMSRPSQYLPSELPSLANVISAREFIGRTRINQRRWPEAAEQFRAILTLDPAHVEAHHLLGHTLFAQEAFQEAAVQYRLYLSAQPNDTDALGRLGIALIAIGQSEEAIAAFRRAVDTDPEDGVARRNLANALLDHREIGEATVHAQQAVRLMPGDPGAHDVFGRALAGQRRFKEAIEHFQRSLQIDPTYADGREHLAQLLSITRN